MVANVNPDGKVGRFSNWRGSKAVTARPRYKVMIYGGNENIKALIMGSRFSDDLINYENRTQICH
jgi:hypothetical protein